MNCHDAVLQLLEAGPADLRGEGDQELARHLAACARCRSMAERILREHDMLAEAVDALRPRRPVEDAVGLARFEAARRKRRRVWLGAAPTLAAAGVAALLIAWPSHNPVTTTSSVAADTAPIPLVESSNADAVTVMHTDNPNIVVIWLTKSRSPS